MKILYISYFYPPFNTIGGARSYGQVKALTEAGCDVKIISSPDQSFERSIDFDISQLKNVIYPSPEIFSSNQLNPSKSYSRNLSKLLKRLAFRYLPSLVLRNLLLIKTIFSFMKDDPIWVKKVARDYKLFLGNWKPDLIFSSFSPIDSHIVASKISKELDIKWVAEFRDCWSHNTMLFSSKETQLSSIILRSYEKKILSGCSLIIAATPFIKSYYSKHYSKPVKLLLGGWDDTASEIVCPNTEKTSDGSKGKKIRILHLGSMLHGTRTIKPIIEMLENYPHLNEKYIFDFVGRDSTFFQKDLLNSNVSNSISLNDQVSFNEAESLGFKADILLILMKKSKMEKYTLTGKIFEYIKFAKPIIAFDPFDSDASLLIQKNNLGYQVRSIEEFANLLENKNSIDQFISIDEKTRQNFKRSNQVNKILESLLKLKQHVN